MDAPVIMCYKYDEMQCTGIHLIREEYQIKEQGDKHLSTDLAKYIECTLDRLSGEYRIHRHVS